MSLGHHRWLHNNFPPFISVLHCSLGLSKLQACPFPDVVFLPLLLSALPSSPFFTVPCKMVLTRSDERETCPYHFYLHLFMMVRRFSCGLIACWILAKTSSLVTWTLNEMRSTLQYYLISMTCILPWSPAVMVHDSQAYLKMDVTRKRISCILELREILLSFQSGFNLVNAAVVCAILESISGLEPWSVITEPS